MPASLSGRLFSQLANVRFRLGADISATAHTFYLGNEAQPDRQAVRAKLPREFAHRLVAQDTSDERRAEAHSVGRDCDAGFMPGERDRTFEAGPFDRQLPCMTECSILARIGRQFVKDHRERLNKVSADNDFRAM